MDGAVRVKDAIAWLEYLKQKGIAREDMIKVLALNSEDPDICTLKEAITRVWPPDGAEDHEQK